jgi:hypothetical protein
MIITLATSQNPLSFCKEKHWKLCLHLGREGGVGGGIMTSSNGARHYKRTITKEGRPYSTVYFVIWSHIFDECSPLVSCYYVRCEFIFGGHNRIFPSLTIAELKFELSIMGRAIMWWASCILVANLLCLDSL